MTWTRREFGGLAGASLVAALGVRAARGQTKARVVVIGGGIGGATVAKYLTTSAATPDVTLVEPKQRYVTCFFSNLYLAIRDTATAIDPVRAMWRSLAAARLKADWPSGNDPTTRVRRLISRKMRSSGLLTGMTITVPAHPAGTALVLAYGATIRDEGHREHVSGQADPER